MRGNPKIRIMLVCLGVILMGFPVFMLTHQSASAAVATPPVVATATKSVAITVTFAHAPETFTVKYLGQAVLVGQGPGTAFQGTCRLSLPREGADLLVEVKWPGQTPQTAVEIQVATKDDATLLTKQTWWGAGALTELVTVPPPQP